jgi:perosamine synthetase
MLSDPQEKGFENEIPLHVPEIRGREWNYIRECLETNWVSSVGAFVDRFEGMVAERVGRTHAVATVNGTAALHTALMVSGIGENDEVLVPALTFIASANAVRYTGAWPVFLDVDPETWQLDPDQVRNFLQKGCRGDSGNLLNKATGRRVRAIMPVHILGHPVDMDPIMELAGSYDLVVIEDAAEGLGALYRDRPVGSAGHIACFSFNGNKIITTGGGGMLVTDDRQWAERARHLTTQAKSDPVEYEHDVVGYNYRLTNIQGAMGCAQMELLDDYIERKRRIAKRYCSALGDVVGITPMPEAPWASSTFWMYTILVDQNRYGADSRGLLRFLGDRNIMSRPLWQPLNLSPAFADIPSAECSISEDIYSRALSIPCSVGLTDEDQARVIDTLREGGGSR